MASGCGGTLAIFLVLKLAYNHVESHVLIKCPPELADG